jgi:hypothetical protein
MHSRLFVSVSRCYMCRIRVRDGDRACPEHADHATISPADLRELWAEALRERD